MIADVRPLCRGITRICDHTQPPIGLHNNNHTKWSSNPLNIGHCCDNKITLAYHANPLTRHKSGHYFWIVSQSGQWTIWTIIWSEPGGLEIQSCYGAEAREFWLIVFTNSIWLDSPSLPLSADGLVIAGSGQLLVRPSSSRGSHNADTDTPTQS